jgi:hypothetical protein
MALSVRLAALNAIHFSTHSKRIRSTGYDMHAFARMRWRKKSQVRKHLAYIDIELHGARSAFVLPGYLIASTLLTSWLHQAGRFLYRFGKPVDVTNTLPAPCFAAYDVMPGICASVAPYTMCTKRFATPSFPPLGFNAEF